MRGVAGLVRHSGIVRRGEEGILVASAALLTLYLEWPIISDPNVFQSDAATHEWWMRRFRDPELFADPLTEAVVDAAWVPPGLRFIYGVAANFVDPVAFAEWMPVVLAPLSAWLVFRIVRTQMSWRPAAWLGAVLFMLPWEIQRFSGGHGRAYMHPIVLSCVFLALRRKNAAAAVIPGLGALFYPPAGIVSGAIFGLSSLRIRPHPRIDKRRFVFAAVSAGLLALVLLVPRIVSEDPPQILTRGEIQALPEFGAEGQLSFFKDSLLEQLQGKYSGFRLRNAGSVLVTTAVLVLLTRFWIRPRISSEIWAMAAGALLMFTAAYAVLFHLYLPHRYTYPLIPFSAILIAVSWQPLWSAISRRLGPFLLWVPLAIVLSLVALYLGLVISPVGAGWTHERFGTWLTERALQLVVVAAGTLAVALVGAKMLALSNGQRSSLLAAALAAAIFVGGVGAVGLKRSATFACNRPLYDYLATVPKDSVVAADPLSATCIPLAARRPVVISRKLYQPWDRSFLDVVRPRMFDMLAAYYGDSIEEILALRDKYGADLLVTRSSELNRRRWRAEMEPFTSLVNRLLADNPEGPAALRLPERCVTWTRGGTKVYDLTCVDSVAAERT